MDEVQHGNTAQQRQFVDQRSMAKREPLTQRLLPGHRTQRRAKVETRRADARRVPPMQKSAETRTRKVHQTPLSRQVSSWLDSLPRGLSTSVMASNQASSASAYTR